MKKVSFLAVMPLALAVATQGFCAEIAGKVADTRGLSVPAAMISLLNPAGKTLATANTDEKGKYLIKQVVPGDYHLSLKPPAGHLVGQTVAVSVNARGETVDWVVSDTAPALALGKPGVEEVAGLDPFGLSLEEFIAASVLSAGAVAGGVVGGYGAAGGFSGSSDSNPPPNPSSSL